MGITIYSLGAAEEVTGSKHIFEIDGRAFMIDCGAFQGRRNEADRKNRNFEVPVDKIESVILTHAHYDHCGLLPLVGKNGYNGNIYATPATRDLANLIMMDSARIQARDAEYLRKQAAKKGEKFVWNPLFTEKDVVAAANQIVTLSYNRKMYIAPDVQLEFFDAGHILGAAFAYITVTGQKNTTNGTSGAKKLLSPKEFWNRLLSRKRSDVEPRGAGSAPPSSADDEIRILYTGDLGRRNKPIIRDPATELPAPDYVVLESTYGNRRHEDSQSALDELVRIVRKAIAQKGKIIIPSFAIERTQELVYYFHLLVDQKLIPEIPIYVDSPMATNATGIFQVHPECYDQATYDAFLRHHKNPFGFNSLSFTTSVEESKALNDKPGPMIIISADGMCEAGRILHHLANNIGNPANQILLVGFMAEHTLGRRLQNGEKEVKIMGEWYEVKADVDQINAFSAHADYVECTEWLKQIDTSRLKQIFMVHGEPDAQAAFKTYLAANGFPDVTIVKYGESYDL
ncbi:MBL fold metallo-hydrolase RNA specificity domain-containing protein [Treponema brennaborense]|uniref:RNA-metabolising metallo-beta-lactamase n=1 Tax=Treponema brennaborense (strain DSM 12168 / CIP 105900 / DD5/3) TaxID=906968 RepID=F4LP54_TREBD|nr:MBL fold metallo-hydrolase [Treponema brennaborense]AEE15930.1 RNA-metabolising metallo-beta-lactamase [Treponema brennaborense DSM 12168]